jgi:3-oxocholest-4-en-26-oyl-CoA dehydrogenase alpha subunit
MDFGIDQVERDVLAEFRAYLDALQAEGFTSPVPPLVRPDHAMEPEDIAERKRFIQRLGQDGWLGIAWPEEFGGRDLGYMAQWLVIEELSWRKLPEMLMSVTMIGPTLMRAGSDEHKRQYLGGILAGDIEFCLGFSEPGAGTDLAALQTRAVLEGDEYVVNGQKVYTTGAQYATHIWLAVRTGAPDSRHRGITLLIVPIDTPGITIRPMITQADYRTNEVFLDNVRVPVANRVGDENGGWAVISLSLDLERNLNANLQVRELDEIIQWAEEADADGQRPADDDLVRVEIGMLAARVEIVRLMSAQVASLIARQEPLASEASMAKVWSSETFQELPSVALDLIGPDGLRSVGSAGAPLHGLPELDYRESPVRKFAAGTNEVQRDIIAQRALGLPRNR